MCMHDYPFNLLICTRVVMYDYSLLSLLPYNTLYIRIQYLYNFIMHSSGVRQQPRNTTPVTTTHVMMTTGRVTCIVTTTDSLLHTTLIINERSITHYSLFIICISSQRVYASWFHLLSRMIVENYRGLLHPNSGSINASHDQPCRLTLSLLQYNTLHIRIQYL